MIVSTATPIYTSINTKFQDLNITEISTLSSIAAKENNRAAFAALNLLQYASKIPSPEKLDLPVTLQLKQLKKNIDDKGLAYATNKLNIYPNPATDQVSITWDKSLDFSNGIITVYNMLGEKVLNATTSNQIGIMLDTKKWVNGIYTATIEVCGNKYNGRIIISK